MIYQTQLRTYTIGGGWRGFREIEATSIHEACQKAAEENIVLAGPNRQKDGTPQKPFLNWYGASEISAIEAIEVVEPQD